MGRLALTESNLSSGSLEISPPMTASTATTVQYLNLAYFGRPADPASLTAFPATGMTDEQIVEAFVKTNEYSTNTLAPSKDGSVVNQTSLINTFYQRLFGRLAVASEITGWTNALATGAVNEDYLGITIMRAGLNLPVGTSMREVLVSKFNSAEAFTTALAADLLPQRLIPPPLPPIRLLATSLLSPLLLQLRQQLLVQLRR